MQLLSHHNSRECPLFRRTSTGRELKSDNHSENPWVCTLFYILGTVSRAPYCKTFDNFIKELLAFTRFIKMVILRVYRLRKSGCFIKRQKPN